MRLLMIANEVMCRYTWGWITNKGQSMARNMRGWGGVRQRWYLQLQVRQNFEKSRGLVHSSALSIVSIFVSNFHTAESITDVGHHVHTPTNATENLTYSITLQQPRRKQQSIHDLC